MQNVPLERLCPVCRGKKMVDDPHCNLCGQRIAPDDSWWDDGGAETMPCGHAAEQHFTERSICIECGGNGRAHSWITSEEMRAMERGKTARRIFLVGMALLALFLIGTAVWSNF